MSTVREHTRSPKSDVNTVAVSGCEKRSFPFFDLGISEAKWKVTAGDMLRVHGHRLRKLMLTDLTVKWSMTLQGFVEGERTGITAHISNSQAVGGSLPVTRDGARLTVHNNIFQPENFEKYQLPVRCIVSGIETSTALHAFAAQPEGSKYLDEKPPLAYVSTTYFIHYAPMRFASQISISFHNTMNSARSLPAFLNTPLPPLPNGLAGAQTPLRPLEDLPAVTTSVWPESPTPTVQLLL